MRRVSLSWSVRVTDMVMCSFEPLGKRENGRMVKCGPSGARGVSVAQAGPPGRIALSGASGLRRPPASDGQGRVRPARERWRFGRQEPQVGRRGHAGAWACRACRAWTCRAWAYRA
ncbi:hypothetical protein GCM10018952_63530 [Streptosporangium vulgare]